MGKMTKKRAAKFWTPKLDGEFYCSPGCGGKCTRKQFDHASTAAKVLAHYLTLHHPINVGDGVWVEVVWENLGWHYKAVSPCRRITVHADSGKPAMYSAEFDGRFWSDSKKTPDGAVRDSIKLAKKAAKEAADLVKGL